MDPDMPFPAAPQPSAPAPQPKQPGGLNAGQYDFITNPPTPPKKMGKLNFGSGGKRILIFAALGAAILTVIIFIFGTLLGGKSSKEQLLPIAKQQTEMIRVAEIGVDKGGTTETKSLANNTKLVMMTDRNAIIASLAKNKVKVKDKELVGVADNTIDQKLATAEQNGTFDQVFTTIMKELLGKYQAEVRAANATIESPSAKEALATSFENAALLIKEADTK